MSGRSPHTSTSACTRCAAHPIVGDTRGIGLVGCVEGRPRGTGDRFARDLEFGRAIDTVCEELGLIVRPLVNMCVFSPPLIITEDQIDAMFDILDDRHRAGGALTSSRARQLSFLSAGTHKDHRHDPSVRTRRSVAPRHRPRPSLPLPALADSTITVFDWSGYEDPAFHEAFIEKHGFSPNFAFFADEEEALPEAARRLQGRSRAPLLAVGAALARGRAAGADRSRQDHQLGQAEPAAARPAGLRLRGQALVGAVRVGQHRA